MDYRRALPFYHAYSQYGDLGQMDADAVAGDLEYLQQMYPSYAKNIRWISQMLDRMDYEGSMIYDQYPDRWQLERFIDNIMTTIKQERGEALPRTGRRQMAMDQRTDYSTGIL